MRVIGSDPKRAHGLAPVLVLADEPAQWPTSTGERMVAALRTAAGKQPHFRFVALGTRPAGDDHWFSKMLAGGADYAQVHAARPVDPKFQARTWARANPSLPHMPDLAAAIRGEARHAKADPAMLPEFEALRLNLGTSEVATSRLIEADTWARIEGEAARSGPCFWGLDLGHERRRNPQSLRTGRTRAPSTCSPPSLRRPRCPNAGSAMEWVASTSIWRAGANW